MEPSKFAGNKPPIPSEDDIWLGDTGDLLKSRAAESLADLSAGGAHPSRKVSPEDAILCCQILILEEQFLIDHASDVGQ